MDRRKSEMPARLTWDALLDPARWREPGPIDARSESGFQWHPPASAAPVPLVTPVPKRSRLERILAALSVVVLVATLAGAGIAGRAHMEAGYGETLRLRRMQAVLNVVRDRQLEFYRKTDRFARTLEALNLHLPVELASRLSVVALRRRSGADFFAELCEARLCLSIDAAGTLRRGTMMRASSPRPASSATSTSSIGRSDATAAIPTNAPRPGAREGRP